MFSMKKEFESVEKNDSVDILLSDYNVNLYKDNFDSLTKEMDILSNMDNALSWFNVDDISYETAINNLERVIDGTGFTIDDFGLSAEDNYTIESGSDSKFNKIWEWIKKRLLLLKNYLLSVFEALMGKYAGPRLIAKEIEKDIRRAFSDVNTESALTYESGFIPSALAQKFKSANLKIKYDDIRGIPGGEIYIDIKKGIKLIEKVSLDTYHNSLEPLLGAIEIIKKEASKYESTGKHDLNLSLKNHFIKFKPSGLAKYLIDNDKHNDSAHENDYSATVHKFTYKNESIVSWVNVKEYPGELSVRAKKEHLDMDWRKETFGDSIVLSPEDILLCSKQLEKLINTAEETSKKVNVRLKNAINSLDSVVSRLHNNIVKRGTDKHNFSGVHDIRGAIKFCNDRMNHIVLSYVDNIDLYLSLGKILNLHKKQIIKFMEDNKK